MEKVIKKAFYLCFLMSLIIISSTQVSGTITPTTLGPIVAVATGYDPDIAVDKDGSLHLAYVRGGSTYYRQVFVPYTEKNMGQEYLVGEGTNPQIAIDSKGYPHVIFGQAMYSYWSGSKFTAPVQAFNGWRKNLIAIDSQDRVYVIADVKSPRSILVRVYKNGNALHAGARVGADNPGGVAIDSSDTVHLTWRNSSTYYDFFSFKNGQVIKGSSTLIVGGSGDFSWVSVDPLTDSVHAVATNGHARGITYTSKRNGTWGTSFTLDRYLLVGEPDDVNPVCSNDAQGYTYITYRGRSGTGYYVVIDENDKIIGDLRSGDVGFDLDPVFMSDAGGKMTNPNVASYPTRKGAFVAWGTHIVKVRSIGGEDVTVVPAFNLLLTN